VSRENWEGSDRFFQHRSSSATVRSRASSFVTRDAYKGSSAWTNSSSNQNTHLDEVGNQDESGVCNPRVKVSEPLLYLHGHWCDEGSLFL